MVNLERGILRLMRVANHSVEVAEAEDFTPYYRRIRFSAPDLVAALEMSPTLWFRLWVPNMRRTDVKQRGYTFVALDREAGTFDADFVLHGTESPASRWAAEAQAGTVTEIAITPAVLAIPPDARRWVMGGDLTALPAINSLIEAAPADVEVLAAVEDGHARHADLPHASHPRLDFRWVEPQGARGEGLTAWMRMMGPAQAYVWGAGERGLVKRIRGLAKEEWGLARTHHFTQAYWIEGRAN